MAEPATTAHIRCEYAGELRAALLSCADTLDAQVAEMGDHPSDTTVAIARNLWRHADLARDAAKLVARLVTAAEARNADITFAEIADAERAFARAAIMARLANR